MLTVDPAKRLRMEDLLDNAWLEGGMGGLLATPGVLNRSQRGAEQAVMQTLNAFHLAHKQGFRLQVCSIQIHFLISYLVPKRYAILAPNFNDKPS